MANRFTGHGPQCWTDIVDMRRALDPNILVKAVDMAAYLENMGDWDIHLMKRPLIYRCPTTGNKYKIEATFYKMTAASLTLRVGAASSIEGRLLGEDGALAAAADTHRTIAGMMFPFYYNAGVDPTTTYESRETTLAIGDGIWVVRKGLVELDYAGATAYHDRLMAAASGEVTPSAAMAGPTAAQIIDNLYTGECIGYCNASAGVAGAGLDEGLLDMPDRYIIV